MMTPLEIRLTKENEALRRELQQVVQENKLLREKIDLLIRRVFGSKSEQMDPAQLELLLEGIGEKKPEAAGGAAENLEADLEESKPKAKTAKPQREISDELLESLPAVEIVLVPQEVQEEPAAYRFVDEEITRQLDYEPARYVCRKIIRKRYAKREAPHQAPVIAPLPIMLERSKAGPGLLASVLTAKYCDHLPLYRQEQIARQRHGIDISRQNMARWVDLAAQWLRPLYQIILGGVWSDGYAQVDETNIQYLDPGHGKARHGYFWTIKRPGGDAVFHWSTSRAAEVLTNIVPHDFRGTLQCDGYSAYPTFARKHGSTVTLAACWAHVRRQFIEAAECGSHKGDALLIVRLLATVYAWEKHMRESQAGPQMREAQRQAKSRMVIERIGAILRDWQKRRRHLPQSKMGKAVSYTLGLWPALQVFLEDGRVEIDNNLVENAIRPTAVGKKNWLFIGQAEAGERSAIVFTIMEACRRRGINPYEYLRDVFTRMPLMSASDYPGLTPENWAAAKPSAKATGLTHRRAAAS